MKEKIINWVLEKDYWFQVLTKLTLEEGAISNEKLKKVYKIILSNYKLNDYEYLEDDLGLEIVDAKEDLEGYIFKKVDNIIGVNAIYEESKLLFDEGLTLIYGENGSGKSGYTRLFNKSFKSNGDINIIEDIFSDDINWDNKDDKEIKARFKFRNIDTKEDIYLQYPKQKNHEIFNTVAVFDSISSEKQVSGENELAIAPMEFDLFDNIIINIGKLKEMLNDDINSKKIENNFLNIFTKETQVYRKIEILDSELDYKSLEKLAIITPEEKKKYDNDTRELRELQNLNIDNEISKLNRLKKDLEEIKEKIKNISNQLNIKSIEDSNKDLQCLKELRKISKEKGVKRFEKYNIKNLGSKEWVAFIEAFNEYIRSTTLDDRCPLCHEKIKQDNDIFNEYQSYLNSEIENKLNDLKQGILIKSEKIKDLDCILIAENQTIYTWLNEEDNKMFNEIIHYQNLANKIKKELILNLEKKSLINNISSDIQNLCPNISLTLNIINDKLNKLNVEETTSRIKKLEKLEHEYIDKLKLKERLKDLKKYIETKLWITDAEKIIKKEFNTIFITSFSNKLFREIVNDDYIKNFERECSNLNADFPVDINIRGSKGNVFSKIIITGSGEKGYEINKILSEGEQKTVALANFIAENQVDKKNHTLIFDDPVSSLDRKRSQNIAKRLSQLSKEKQIIVFTHDLVFYNDLLQQAKKESVKVNEGNIKKINKKSGIFSAEAPWNGLTVNKRIKKLEIDLKDLEKQYNEIQNSYNIEANNKFNRDAKTWCEYIRETWERSVEELVLNQTIVRYRPSIETNRLKKIIINEDVIESIIEGMREASNYVHDKSPAEGELILTPYIMRNMLDNLKKHYKDQKK